MKEFSLSPLHYVSLPGYSFDCWLMSSGVTLDILQDKQMLDDFVEAKRGGICGICGKMVDRYINNSNRSMAKHDRRSIREPASQIWYIDANKPQGSAMMRKLPYKGFVCFDTSLYYGDTMLYYILNTPDDSDHGYYIICDIIYTNCCKYRTEQLALMPNKRKTK